MKTELFARAPAKINLALDVLGRREDGYHDLRMIMLSVTLYDDITITLSEDGGKYTASSDAPHLPTDHRNLALRAAGLYLSRTGRESVSCAIYIRKRIPVCAGLGGGSSDAAAVLRALHAHFDSEVPFETLMEWALEIGSDVPYCLHSGFCLAEGRGEILSPLPPLPDCRFVLCIPPVVVSTASVYRMIDRHPIVYRPDWKGIDLALTTQSLVKFARRLYNVFEDPVSEKHRSIAEIRKTFMDLGALGAVMSGTGASVVGLFADEISAQAANDTLLPLFPNTFIARPI